MKKAKKIVTLILSACFFLLCCGCKDEPIVVAKADGSYEAHQEKVAQMEQTGDSSYIPGVRTGIMRTGISFSSHEFECTDDGVYYLAITPIMYNMEGNQQAGNAPFLYFAPHDSDQFIKLCGRPDCTHDTIECNACFMNAVGGVTYYNGHLYIAQVEWDGKELFELYRVSPDGTNRVKLGSFGEKEKYSGWTYVVIIDRVFTYILTRIDSETGKKVFERYYYALDGSMTEPVLAENGFSHINQESMDVQIAQEGDKLGYMIYSVDFRNDEWTPVFDAIDYDQGYWGKNFGYTLSDNAVVKVHYEDGREEPLFETGLVGEYHPRFFPDCIVLTQTADADSNLPEIPMVYFYSWEGEYLGELPIDFPYSVSSVVGIMGGGESKDRIYLWTSQRAGHLPTYYIEKSDFGTGKIELHKCQYPDLDDADYQLLFGFE